MSFDPNSSKPLGRLAVNYDKTALEFCINAIQDQRKEVVRRCMELCVMEAEDWAPGTSGYAAAKAIRKRIAHEFGIEEAK